MREKALEKLSEWFDGCTFNYEILEESEDGCVFAVESWNCERVISLIRVFTVGKRLEISVDFEEETKDSRPIIAVISDLIKARERVAV